MTQRYFTVFSHSTFHEQLEFFPLKIDLIRLKKPKMVVQESLAEKSDIDDLM